MNHLLRTLTIVAVITLSAATLAPAQRRSDSRLAGSEFDPVSDATSPPAAESKLDVMIQLLGKTAETVPTSRRSRSRGSSGYLMSSSSWSSRSKRQVFIIPAAEIERDHHLAIERDIHVMSHIFDRVLKKPVNRIGGVFTVMDDFFGRDSHVTQVIYADGYGAMFFMNVDFALVGPPPASAAKEPNVPEEKVDTAWKQAERELYAPQNITWDRSAESRPRPEYDAEKVELLKRNLVETLKHAANIKALKSDESVILTVTGRAIMVKKMMLVEQGKGAKWTYLSDKWVPVTGEPRERFIVTPLPSVLTIRAKKSDIDGFSKGELDFNEFYKRTQLLATWSGAAAVERPSTIPSELSIIRR